MTTAREIRDSTDGGARNTCIEPERLAAFLDGRLPPVDRGAIETHLSNCAACRAELAEAASILGALEGSEQDDGVQAQSAEVVATSRLRVTRLSARTRLVVGGLCAAALLVLAATTALMWRSQAEARQVASLRDGLSRAVGETRPFEPRVEGFRFGPLRVFRSGSDTGAAGQVSPAVALASAEAELFAESHGSAAAQRVGGVARLVMRDYDDAIAALGRAAALAPASASAANDLAAAYLTRGLVRNDPGDLAHGLAEARRALALDAQLAEARYNEALALTRLAAHDATQRAAAREAWAAYLAIDGGSLWAAEARAMRAELQSDSSQR